MSTSLHQCASLTLRWESSVPLLEHQIELVHQRFHLGQRRRNLCLHVVVVAAAPEADGCNGHVEDGRHKGRFDLGGFNTEVCKELDMLCWLWDDVVLYESVQSSSHGFVPVRLELGRYLDSSSRHRRRERTGSSRIVSLLLYSKDLPLW